MPVSPTVSRANVAAFSMPTRRTASTTLRRFSSGMAIHAFCAAAVEPFDFDDIYGAWWNTNVIGGGKQAMAVSVDRYLAAIA